MTTHRRKGPMPPAVKAEAQRILDAEARRILAEREAGIAALASLTRWKNGKRVD